MALLQTCGVGCYAAIVWRWVTSIENPFFLNPTLWCPVPEQDKNCFSGSTSSKDFTRQVRDEQCPSMLYGLRWSDLIVFANTGLIGVLKFHVDDRNGLFSRGMTMTTSYYFFCIPFPRHRRAHHSCMIGAYIGLFPPVARNGSGDYV